MFLFSVQFLELMSLCLFLQEGKYHLMRCIDSGLWVPDQEEDDDEEDDDDDEGEEDDDEEDVEEDN